MRRKVLLLNPPGRKLYIRDYYSSLVSKLNYYWPPIDLQVFSGYLFGRHEVRVLDALIERMSPRQAYEKILDMDIDTIVFLTGAVSWAEDFEFLGKIADARKVDMIGSGDILLYHGRELMQRYEFLNAVSLDFTTSDILRYLEGAGNGTRIDNFIYRKNGSIMVGERTTTNEYSIPVPRHELFPLSRYSTPMSRRYPLTGIITDFGCAFACSFCPYANIKFKTRKLDNILEEMRYLSDLGIKELVFRDQTFTAPREKVYSLCSAMIDAGFKFSWMAITRVDCVDKGLLRIMKEAGCHSLIFGVETQNDEVLKKYRKGITAEQSKEAFKLCRQAEMRPSAYIIIGLPGETRESVYRSIEFVKGLGAEYVSFSIATPRVGTPFREQVIKDDLVISNTLSGLDSSFSQPLIKTEELTPKEIWEIRNYAIRSFYLNPSFIMRRLRSISSFRDARNMLVEGAYFCKNYYKSIFSKKEKGADSTDDYYSDSL